MNVGSLFTGIGGFDLGLERAGMRVVWQCEQDEFCRRVLARHWPGVPCHPDVRALVGQSEGDGCGSRWPGRSDPAGAREQQSERSLPLPVPVPYVDVLCAGWPCPGFSVAGRGAGFDHEGSGLWVEVARLVGELRPRYVVLENVAALLARGFGRVLGDLAAVGYDAEWDCIPASAVGASHRRDRVWIVAYPDGGRQQERGEPDGNKAQPGFQASQWYDIDGSRADMADPEREGLQGGTKGGVAGTRQSSGVAAGISEGFGGQWLSEPDVGRVAHGVPHRVDRLRSLGNALVPQIAEWIGRRIMGYEGLR